MPSYSRLKSILNATFRGSSESATSALRPVAATLDRPEGVRRYLIAAAGQRNPGKRALVVVLHGAGASAEQVLGLAFPPSPLSVWLDIAEREQLVVVAPDAGKGGWNDCFASDARVARKDDVAFVGAVIDRAIAEHGVDPQRVYLIGVSRGGHMAYRVAAEIPHRLAALSTVLANMPAPGRARMPAVALPTLVFGATADPLMPYHGGKYFYMLGFLDPVSSIEESVKIWRELAGLPAVPDVSHPVKCELGGKTSVTCFMWGQASDGLQVGLYRIEHGGHVEPSRRKRYPRLITALVGAQNADVEVAEAAWEFFRDKRAGSAAAGASGNLFSQGTPGSRT